MQKKQKFKTLLNKYLKIKGLDIIVIMKDGKEIELNKNRKLVNNDIIYRDKHNSESKIPISKIQYVDFFAA